MTSDVTYPRFDTFSAILDGNRCAAVSPTGRRCQLYPDHAEPHAAGWIDAQPLDRHWTRWDATEEWEQSPGSERLRWCCLYRD